jgi:hypothetical protein
MKEVITREVKAVLFSYLAIRPQINAQMALQSAARQGVDGGVE